MRGGFKPTTNKTNNKHMANIQPLGQRVLVKRLAAEALSAGGIALPDTAQEKPQEAEVVSLGTGGKDEDGKTIEFSVKVGDKVLISKYGGTEVKVDGDEMLIMSESDILGIVS
jgi:chaperonin GroES